MPRRLALPICFSWAGRGLRSSLTTPWKSFTWRRALEYINAWRSSTADNPVGICGPIGPTEQLPLVARLVNDLGLNLLRRAFLGHG